MFNDIIKIFIIIIFCVFKYFEQVQKRMTNYNIDYVRGDVLFLNSRCQNCEEFL